MWSGYDALLAAPDFTRTPQPEISLTFVLLGLLLSARVLQPSTKRGTVVVAGLVGALIVYSYYFYAIAWGMALGMLLVLTLVWRNWAVAKRIAVLLSVMSQPRFRTLLLRSVVEPRGARPTYWLAWERTLMRPVWFRYSTVSWDCSSLEIRREPQARMGIFILLAGVAGLNFQVLSGYDAQYMHFWNRLILPVAFFLCGCWLLSAAESQRRGPLRAFNGAALVILIFILLNAGARQMYVGARIAEQQHASRPESELLMWARSHLPFGSVIGTVDPDLILMIPAMGPNFTYAYRAEVADAYE